MLALVKESLAVSTLKKTSLINEFRAFVRVWRYFVNVERVFSWLCNDIEEKLKSYTCVFASAHRSIWSYFNVEGFCHRTTYEMLNLWTLHTIASHVMFSRDAISFEKGWEIYSLLYSWSKQLSLWTKQWFKAEIPWKDASYSVNLLCFRAVILENKRITLKINQAPCLAFFS